MSNQKFISVTYARALATCLIFFCHILFISNNFEASMWLNIGVPLFFIISAFLMSVKTFGATWDARYMYYIKRLKSIFPAYLIYVLSIVITLIIIGRSPSLEAVIMYAFGLAGFADESVLGLGHLWFISVLLICYIITPWLYRILNSNVEFKKLVITIFLLTLFVLFILVGYPSYGIHICTYAIAYIGFFRTRQNISKHDLLLWSALAIVSSIIRLILDPIFMVAEYKIYYYYDALFQPLSRFSVAMALFCLFEYFSRSMTEWSLSHSFLGKSIQSLSNISYEIYLSHQFIQLSIWELFPCVHSDWGLILWIFGSVILTWINSQILAFLEKKVEKKLNVLVKVR